MGIRLVRSVTLHGVNWYCDRSVALVAIEGSIRPDAWPAALALIDRVLPSGVGISTLQAPATAVGAVGALAADICRWGGFPVQPQAPRARTSAEPRWVALPLRFAPLMHGALELAAEALDLADRGDDGAVWSPAAQARLFAIKAEADRWMVGSRRLIAAAAEARGIPWHVHRAVPTMLMIGEGRHGHRYDATATPGSNAIATMIGISKQRTNAILARGGIPVARQARLDDKAAAHRVAERYGFPFVLKPTVGRLQRGVAVVFRTEDVDAAFDDCAATGMEVLAESFIPGREFRALVIGGHLVSVIEQVPARVVGDGRSTIEQLVEIANLDRRRGPVADGFPMRKVAWNEVTLRFLAFTGRTPTDVPREGETVQTYPLPMLRYGGELKVDVTDAIHPETVAMLEHAVTLIGLDVGGIDFRTPDVTRSWREVGAGICEINPQPNLGIHYSLAGALERDVAGMLLDRTLPTAPGRMTHVAVIDVADGNALAAAIRDGLVAAMGWRVGLVTPDRVELDGRQVARVPRRFEEIVDLVIEDPTLDAAVYAVSAEVIARFGLGLRRVDVAVTGPVGPSDQAAPRVADATVRAAGARILEVRAQTTGEIVGLVLDGLRADGRTDAAA